MKVFVWNMAHRIESWNSQERLNADIALLNEARVPSAGLGERDSLGGQRTIGRDGYDRPWATAVVSSYPMREIDDARGSRKGKPIPIEFENSRPGSWTAASVTTPDLGEVTAVSLYGLMDEKSDASVHRSLSELAPLFEDDRYNRNVLLGGDLNTWTGWKPGAHLDRDRVVLERIAAYGFVDCLAKTRQPGHLADCPCGLGDDCSHTRTRIDPRYPGIPYQMDYLFASSALAERLATCATHSAEDSPSDHFPIVATFA